MLLLIWKKCVKKDGRAYRFFCTQTEKAPLHCVSLKKINKYGKNQAKIVLFVRADGIKCEPMIIFKRFSGEKIDKGYCLKIT